MSKRRESNEEVILRFFRTEPLEVAEAIARVIEGELKARRPLKVPLIAPRKAGRPKKSSLPKVIIDGKVQEEGA